MAQKLTFTPTGVCSRMIEIEVEDGVVKHVEFTGGCSATPKAWPGWWKAWQWTKPSSAFPASAAALSPPPARSAGPGAAQDPGRSQHHCIKTDLTEENMNTTYLDEYRRWRNSGALTADEQSELAAIAGQRHRASSSFHRANDIRTAGLRAV